MPVLSAGNQISRTSRQLRDVDGRDKPRGYSYASFLTLSHPCGRVSIGAVAAAQKQRADQKLVKAQTTQSLSPAAVASNGTPQVMAE
jgi:hypothetical protein